MRRVLLALGACATLSPCAADGISIELLPHARVAAGAVVLGQVAHLRTADLGLMRRLVDLPIGRAPGAGKVAWMDRAALMDWVRGRARVADAQVQWSGTEAVRVVGASRTLVGEEIAAAAAEMLHTWLAAEGGRAELQVERPPRDLEVPEGPLRLQARPLGQAQLRKRMLVWVDVWAGRRFVRTVPVAFLVAAGSEPPAAAVPLAAVAPLPSVPIGLREIEVAGRAAGPAMPPAPDASLRSRSGEVVRLHDVPRVPAVARGQWASLRAEAGVVTLETRVEVLQDGRTGDKVRVRQPGATAGVMAKVLGPGQLEIAR